MTAPDDLDDIIRGLLHTATQRDNIADNTIPLGAAISTCNAAEAAAFANNVDDWITMKRGGQ